MASVLVDTDDLSYMDEVDDADITGGETREPGKHPRRRKNQPIKEEITINSDDIMVKELRQDRRERLQSKKDEQLSAETGDDMEKLVETGKIESLNMVKELREERRQAQRLEKEGRQQDYEMKNDVHKDKSQNTVVGEVDRRQTQTETEMERKQTNSEMTAEDVFDSETTATRGKNLRQTKKTIHHCAEIHVTNDQLDETQTITDSAFTDAEEDIKLPSNDPTERFEVKSKPVREKSKENKSEDGLKDPDILILSVSQHDTSKVDDSYDDSVFENGAINKCDTKQIPEKESNTITAYDNYNNENIKACSSKSEEGITKANGSKPVEGIPPTEDVNYFDSGKAQKDIAEISQMQDSSANQELDYTSDFRLANRNNNGSKPNLVKEPAQKQYKSHEGIDHSEQDESVDDTEVLLDKINMQKVKYKHKKRSSLEVGNGIQSAKKSHHKSPQADNRGNSQNESSVKIIVTSVDGTELEAHHPTKRNRGNDVRKLSKSASDRTSTSDRTSNSDRTSDIDTDEDDSFVALNFIRKLSQEKPPDLLKQRELYNKSKAKPFKDLVKVRRGTFAVGIEGESKRSHIKAITILPDKRMIMYDRHNKCLKLFDKDFNPLDKLSVTTKFCGLAAIFDETVAATFPDTKKLQLYHIDSNTNKICRERTHDIEEEFYSIAHYRNKLYLLQRNRKSGMANDDEWQIRRFDLNNNVTKDLRTFTPGHQDCTLCATHEGVYMTNKLESDVLLLGHDGTFKCRYKTELSLPLGITSDKFGNIFVCGGSVTSFIEIFKPDLSGSKLIFKKTSSDPVAMCFDKDEDTLIVCDKISGKIMKYKIEYKGIVQGLMRSFVMGSGGNET